MYNLHNQPFPSEQTTNEPTVPFHTLTHGQFKHPITGNVSSVFLKESDSITVKRHDGWLVTVNEGDWGWDREVIKVK